MKFQIIFSLLVLIVTIQMVISEDTKKVQVSGIKDKMIEGTKEYFKMIEEKFDKLKAKFYQQFEKMNEEDTDLANIWHFDKVKPLWQPSSELIETKTSYLVKMELPGMKKEDIKVEIQSSPDDEKKSLKISGSKKKDKVEKDFYHHLKETNHGYFERSWTFANKKISNEVKANYLDGVLTVEMKKNEKPKNKEVEEKTVEVK
eukprot:gene10529-3050_t